MKFLVLGSEGQIGHHLSKFLEKKGYEVTHWDIKLGPGHDLTKPGISLENAIKDADFIYFLAYDVGGSKYLKRYQDTFEFIHNNALIMSNTFALIKKHNKKVVFASSQMVRLPNSNYGRLKIIGESYTKAVGGIFSRFWNVYGVEEEEDKAHVITDFIKKAKHERHIKMLTTGNELRQFLHADDCCEALYVIYENYDNFTETSGEERYAVDVSSFEWTSIKDVAKIISEEFPGTQITASGEKDEIQIEELGLFEPNKEILKFWQPKIKIDDGIKMIISQMEEKGLLKDKKIMEKRKVSTITPCFKMKQYLPKFLDELPSQTYFDNLEIVLDHNEPDEEEIKWVEDFNKKYPGKIKHIIIPKVDPIGTSMNRCIKEATGELVTIWNVDDLRTPESIESQVKAIQEEGADIAIGDYRIVRNFGEKKIGKIISHNNIPESEFKRSMWFGPFVMFKKSLCEKAGYFDEQLRSGADFDLSVRLAYNGKVTVAKDLLGYYLNEGKGASTRPNSKQPAERTVIELRYGIFDKIDMNYVPATISYSVPTIINFGIIYPVSSFVHNYESIIEEGKKGISKSIFMTSVKSITLYDKIKSTIKNNIKKIIYANR